MTTDKKITLEEAVSQADAGLHNSNMTNAANAIVAANAYRARIDAAETRLRKAAEEPTAFEDFKKAYDALMKLIDRV